MTRPDSLAARLFIALLAVIVVAGLTMAATVVLVAPRLFREHLSMTGENSPIVQQHAQDAFESSVALAFLAAGMVAVCAAALLAWFLTRRVSRPIAALATAAESVACGDYDVEVPCTSFGSELTALSSSFQEMAARLEATDMARARLLADLAHELRTPLATVEAHIDGLEDGILTADPETYAVMRDQVGRMRRLAQDLRLAADAQEHALHLDLRLHDSGGLLRTACDAAAPRFVAKGVRLECRPGAELPPDRSIEVSVDPDRMQQVLGNLLDNALRHTPPRGSVNVGSRIEDGHLVISVVDTGDGIPPDQLTTVFDRFVRLDAARQHDRATGSGLGLTIARAIVADHHGTLTAHSHGSQPGTTMLVTLPLDTSARAEPR